MIATSKHKYPQNDKIHLTDLVDTYEVSYVVFATRGVYQFANDNIESTSTNLRWSDDYGQTWTRTYAWAVQFSSSPVYNRAIKFAHIFADGTLIFATAAQMYISTDHLVTVNTLSITGYTKHTPVSASLPGCYFQSWTYDEPSTLSNGKEIVVIGNYHNLPNDCGAAPTVLFYIINNGSGNVVIKKVYEFGQNENARDNGSLTVNNVGTLIGDSGNSEKVRHCHGVVRRPGTLEWYACFGDFAASDASPNAGINEIKWSKHVYDENTDTWTNSILFTKTTQATRWKSAGFVFSDDSVVFNSDATGNPALTELGMFSVPVASAGTDAASTRILDHGYLEANQLKIDDKGNVIIIMYGNFAYSSDWSRVVIATDQGHGRKFFTFQIPIAAGVPSHIFGIFPKDDRGYYFIQSGYVNSEKRGTYFIKFK